MKKYTFSVTIECGPEKEAKIKVALSPEDHKDMIFKTDYENMIIPTDCIADSILDAIYENFRLEGLVK